MAVDRTVHIVDDNDAVRQSLLRLLQSAGFAAVGYPSASALLDAAPALSSGCILLDLQMPGMQELEAQVRLRELDIALPLVVMTGQGDVQTAVRAVKTGAADFIEKPFEDDRLLDALESALARSARRARARDVREAAERIASLTRREREVLEALVAGHSNKLIAHDLGISPRTVEVHRARMLERLGTASLAEAIRLAVLATLAPARAAPRSKRQPLS
jgi:two-component system response regulator FixJ